uniref:EOG090X0ILG n=1 Tax=Scapholeberis mucronata TaxID=202097 RepID=A0A4Y7NPF0_9CRUS|nr:EOG090X0ILG [Scapholeberis mucronata]SVE93995.1 EOG090X0ILG [Scapholeberis mucronata]
MSDNQWEPVIIRKKLPKGVSSKSEKVVNAARRQGLEVETVTKFGAATNKHVGTTLNTAKLDQESEELKHASLSLDVAKLIQKGRQDKGFTQKDLATKINEKPQVITDYEAGRGIPNQQILGKIERAIGIKLRGKDKGQPLEPPGSKTVAANSKK